MTNNQKKNPDLTACSINKADLSGINVLDLHPTPPPADYLQAMELAKEEAGKHMEEFMLISWYDRDRDFESPQHTTESDDPSATPGYVNYGISHGAQLKVDIEDGRFIFFFTPIDF